MKILLSADQEARLVEWVGLKMEAQVGADCEPCGYELVILVCGPYGASAEVRVGALNLELGEVEVHTA